MFQLCCGGRQTVAQGGALGGCVVQMIFNATLSFLSSVPRGSSTTWCVFSVRSPIRWALSQKWLPMSFTLSFLCLSYERSGNSAGLVAGFA